MAESTFLLFRTAGRVLALGSGLARQVVPIEHVFSMPGTSGGLLGLLPVAGRSLPLVDLAALANLGGSTDKNELALICEIGNELLALPVREVIGTVQEENAPATTALLSEEQLLGGYLGGGQKAQIINPHTLLSEIQKRFVPL